MPRPSPLATPAAAPVAPFDSGTFERILSEVDSVSSRTRDSLQAQRLRFFRVDGFAIMTGSATVLASAVGPVVPDFYAYLAPGWMMSVAMLVVGITLLVLPRTWHRVLTRVLASKWGSPRVAGRPGAPNLARSVRVADQMKKDWESLSALSWGTVLFLIVGLLSVSSFASTVSTALLSPDGLAAARTVLLVTEVGVLVPGAFLGGRWWWRTHGRVAALRPLVYETDARFRELERSFWNRY